MNVPMASNEMELWLLEMSIKHLKFFQVQFPQNMQTSTNIPYHLHRIWIKSDTSSSTGFKMSPVMSYPLRCSRVQRVRESLLASFGWFLWVVMVQYCTMLHNIAPPPDSGLFWWRTSSLTFGHWESKSGKCPSSMIKQRSMMYFLFLKRGGNWLLEIDEHFNSVSFLSQPIIPIKFSGRNGFPPILLQYRLKKVDPAERALQVE